MVVNLGMLYDVLQDNPPALAVLLTFLVQNNLTPLNTIEEEKLSKPLHVIYTRLNDQFNNQPPMKNGPRGEPINIIESAITEEVDEYELISGGCIIFNLKGERVPIPGG